jgi:hypothetical protein
MAGEAPFLQRIAPPSDMGSLWQWSGGCRVAVSADAPTERGGYSGDRPPLRKKTKTAATIFDRRRELSNQLSFCGAA